MSYVDGFIVPVKSARKDEYFEFAAKMAPVFREHGAINVFECWGDNLEHGKVTDFYMAVKAEDDENVVFSWITWPSKEVRDAGWAKIMADESLMPSGDMAFDGKRMFWGGFDAIVENQG